MSSGHTPNPSRPTWDKTRLAMAREIAKRSQCIRDKIGAVITDAGNKIIGEGYNGPPHGFKYRNTIVTEGFALPCREWCPRGVGHAFYFGEIDNLPDWGVHEGQASDYSDCPSLHAEANALMMSDRSLRIGGTIYITSHPCFTCAKLITNSGLARVVVSVDGEHEYRRNGDQSYKFLTDCGIKVSINES